MQRFLQWLLGMALLLFAPFLWAAVNINSADVTALDTLPGIGPAKAQALVEYRQAHGPFKSVDALAGVHGIGPKLLERLRPALTLDGATTLPQSATILPRVSKKNRVPASAGEERVIRRGSRGYLLENSAQSNAFSYRHFSLKD